MKASVPSIHATVAKVVKISSKDFREMELRKSNERIAKLEELIKGKLIDSTVHTPPSQHDDDNDKYKILEEEEEDGEEEDEYNDEGITIDDDDEDNSSESSDEEEEVEYNNESITIVQPNVNPFTFDVTKTTSKENRSTILLPRATSNSSSATNGGVGCEEDYVRYVSVYILPQDIFRK